MKKHRFFSILVAVCLVATLALAGSLVVSADEPPTEVPTVGPVEEPSAGPTESVEPVDTDGDGVPDDADLCEDTPEGTEVDEDGCAVLTEEPTEEPTAEPTEEPTVEPTEEPTAEPTEEPTLEPTEEPTLEPTEEPTLEPTEEPTLEPTEEPTEEPTLEPTEEPTLEPTEEPTVALVGEEVGATAFGSWTTEAIAVQNISGGSATAQLALYQGGGSDPVQTIDLGTLTATGNAWVFPSQISNNGRYAGVISADGAMAAAVLNYNATGAAADFYYGENNPATIMWCPLVFGANYSGGWYSLIHAQNATGSTQNVQIQVYVAGSTSPLVTTSQAVAANASYTFDLQNDSRFSAFASNYGYAKLTGLGGNIAVVVDNLRARSSSGEQMSNSYSAVSDSAAGTTLMAPLVFKTYSGNWNSGINVLNVGAGQTTVTAQYTPSSACAGCSGGSDLITINPGAVGTFYLPSRPVPHDAWFGSVQLTSTGGNNILAVANTTKYASTGSVGYSVQAANPNIATTRVAVPIVYEYAGTSNAWITGIQVSNLGGATNVTLDYVRAPGCSVGSATYSWTQSVGASGAVTFYTPSHPSSIPNGWYGSVYVSSAASNNLLVSVSNTGYALGVAGTMAGINYTP